MVQTQRPADRAILQYACIGSQPTVTSYLQAIDHLLPEVFIGDKDRIKRDTMRKLVRHIGNTRSRQDTLKVVRLIQLL